ncbi:MAG: hypothetical protein WBA17_01865 [Saprospiraceae bacterium]
MLQYRRRHLQETARRLDLEYQEEDRYDLTVQLQDFRLFRRGRRGRVRHILRRQDGLMEHDLRIFDYRYLVFNGKRSRPVNQTVFYMQSAKLGLPEMWMRPETLTHKIGELFGMKDIDFVRYPKFSDQYRLTGGDEEYIRHHFTDEVLRYFTLQRGWNIEGLGYYFLLYKKGVLLSPLDVERLYRRGTEVYELLTDEAARNRVL